MICADRTGAAWIAAAGLQRNVRAQACRFTLTCAIVCMVSFLPCCGAGAHTSWNADEGRAVFASCFLPNGDKGLELFSIGGKIKLVSMEVHELKSSWGKR